MINQDNNIKQEVESLSKSLTKNLFFDDKDNNIDFFISSLTEYNPYNSTEEIEEWLAFMNKEKFFSVERIDLDKMKKWSFDKNNGDLKHDSGGFFSIKGLKVETNWGNVSSWTQPIIHQPEIGILGIITQKINGILYFLLQAKAEPGNINTYQLSPTVQATRSNYLQLHGGKSTEYLEYFIDTSLTKVLIDQLQSEQGARFYHKRNRNIIIRLKDDYNFSHGENHRWLTLGQIIKLTKKDNTVNMDTRSVISSISYEPEKVTDIKQINIDDLKNSINNFSLISEQNIDLAVKLMISLHPNSIGLNTSQDILRKIAKRKFECELNSRLIPLNAVKKWKLTNNEIYHPERKYFSIIGVHIETINREVGFWDQPIVKQDHPGLVGFILKEINGVIHFLTQLKLECGVMDLLEISPTVQCITSNYDNNKLPLYVDTLLEENKYNTITNAYQSEEGGRFFQESNQNIILQVDDSFPIDLDPNFVWMTLGQLKQFIRYNNFLNVEARSLLSCL